VTPHRRIAEELGGQRFELETVGDLDQALDALCADLEAQGRSGDPDAFDLCPYFGVVWPSARALTEEILSRADALAGRSVLEVGCGLALPSIAAARLGASVTATDFHPEVPGFLARNQVLNAVEVRYLAADWRQGPLPLGPFDLVLATGSRRACGS
jgi:predicted nicotinamide N-methyase